MKRTLYLKFLLGYVLFGILGFLIVSTLTSDLTLNYIEKQTIASLYRESNLLAGNYASNYYRGTMTLDDVKSHFKAVATYLDADIWVVGPDGKIMINSRPESAIDEVIQTFDISSFGTKYYQEGTFFSAHLSY